jgi:hypothetical protein
MMFGYDEFNRRAKLVGELVSKVLAAPRQGTFLLTHSLGGICGAAGVQLLDAAPSGIQWWNFQGALPFNAFDPTTGEYRRVSEYFSLTNPNHNAKIVWHSEADLVLTFLYGMATLEKPMGLYGANANETNFENISVMDDVQSEHGPKNYFDYIDLGSHFQAPFA